MSGGGPAPPHHLQELFPHLPLLLSSHSSSLLTAMHFFVFFVPLLQSNKYVRILRKSLQEMQTKVLGTCHIWFDDLSKHSIYSSYHRDDLLLDQQRDVIVEFLGLMYCAFSRLEPQNLLKVYTSKAAPVIQGERFCVRFVRL
jgi:hypothetical protein